MRTKRRGDLLLDFTSLLDITLIILFFFIMFSSFSSDSKTREAEDKAEKAVAAAEQKMQEAEERENKAAEREAEMQAELDELRRTSGDSANQSEGISEFASGENMKLIYSAENGYWKFEVRQGETTAATIDRANAGEDSLLKALAGIPADRYIFCECIMLSPEYIDSRNALDAMIKKAQERYPHLLVSKTYI
jgi:hypothetical protein